MNKTENFKTKDLMIGDFVICDDKVTRVIDISECPDRYCILIVELDNGCNYIKSEVSPIKLTAEILEKNGFKQEYDGYVWNDGINCNEQVYVFCGVKKNGNVNRLEIKNHSTNFYDCFQELSVDRFQRILRICGLTEFADNLKILLL